MKTARALNDCFLHDKDRLRHDEALAILQSALPVLAGTETVPLELAHKRILATDLTAPRNIPAHDNAAVDGYAFCHADYNVNNPEIEISARIAAGQSAPSPLPPNTAVRIFTGAPMPKGADTIAMQEDCTVETRDGMDFVTIGTGLAPGANCRLAGEDVVANQSIANRGDRLAAQDIAALASCGFGEVSLYKPLKIALASNGDEVIRPGEAFSPGKVYDSNHFMLRSLLARLPVEITDLGVIPDDQAQTREVLVNAAADHDLIITSAGASMGEEDHVIALLDEVGERKLWQLAIKPGRPMCFGTLQDTAFFGLPGNPVASFVCFLLYMRPSILKMAGGHWHQPRRFPLPANFEIAKKKIDRREFWRAMLRQNKSGEMVLEKFPRDGSGLISGLRQADGLIEVGEELTSVSTGQVLNFIPWSEFDL